MFVSIVLLSLVSLTLSTPHKCQQFPCGRATPKVDQDEERATAKIIVPFDAEVERSHQCQQLPCGRTAPEASQMDMLTRDGGYPCPALCALLNGGSCANC